MSKVTLATDRNNFNPRRAPRELVKRKLHCPSVTEYLHIRSPSLKLFGQH